MNSESEIERVTAQVNEYVAAQVEIRIKQFIESAQGIDWADAMKSLANDRAVLQEKLKIAKEALKFALNYVDFGATRHEIVSALKRIEEVS
jgi:hypothetical protein